jgi:hypothetical protein
MQAVSHTCVWRMHLQNEPGPLTVDAGLVQVPTVHVALSKRLKQRVIVPGDSSSSSSTDGRCQPSSLATTTGPTLHAPYPTAHLLLEWSSHATQHHARSFT